MLWHEGRPRLLPPDFIEPCLPTLSKRPPALSRGYAPARRRRTFIEDPTMPIGLDRHFVDRTPLLALAFLAAGLTLAAGDDKGGSSSGPIVPPWSSEPACPPPPPTTWEFQCSRGMPATPAAAPGGLWYFNF